MKSLTCYDFQNILKYIKKNNCGKFKIKVLVFKTYRYSPPASLKEVLLIIAL
jgi:hypothetical protein